MFSGIIRRLKSFALLNCIIGCLVSFVIGVEIMNRWVGNTGWWTGFGVIIFGMVYSWMANISHYGMGEVVEEVEAIHSTLGKILDKMDGKDIDREEKRVDKAEKNRNLGRFLLTFFLGWIGSFIINHTRFKPEDYTSRTGCYFFLNIVTLGIYGLVASICNLIFDPDKDSNIGYKWDDYVDEETASVERDLKNRNLARFLLVFFLGWIGSIIINHSQMKPKGYTSRTGSYILLSIVTFGIYGLIACIYNLTFDPANEKNIGYKKD